MLPSVYKLEDSSAITMWQLNKCLYYTSFLVSSNRAQGHPHISWAFHSTCVEEKDTQMLELQPYYCYRYTCFILYSMCEYKEWLSTALEGSYEAHMRKHARLLILSQ